MGGLRKKMPRHVLDLHAGTLALAGLPPFSGFYSKDSISRSRQHKHRTVRARRRVAALTTFYMFAACFVRFLARRG